MSGSYLVLGPRHMEATDGKESGAGMSAQEAIETSLHNLGWGYNVGDDDIREAVRAILDALKAAGYAVVKLPESSVNSEDDAQWLTASHTITQGFSGEVVIDDRLGVDGCELAELGSVIMAAAARYAKSAAADAAEKAGQ